MKKEDHLKIEKVNLGPNKFFDFLNALPFSPEGFFTFLVVLAHGVAIAVKNESFLDKIRIKSFWIGYIISEEIF